MSDDIRTLTAAIASGDLEAFAAFYRRWFDFTFDLSRRFCKRDEQFCLDVVQETMMRVIRHMKPLQSEKDIQRWLNTVVRSTCYDLLRKDARRHRRERVHTPPQSAAQDRDAIEWLRRSLQTLSPDDVQLLWLRFRLGWTLQRIGSAIGLKTGAVDGRLSRLLAALRRKGTEDLHD